MRDRSEWLKPSSRFCPTFCQTVPMPRTDQDTSTLPDLKPRSYPALLCTDSDAIGRATTDFLIRRAVFESLAAHGSAFLGAKMCGFRTKITRQSAPHGMTV